METRKAAPARRTAGAGPESPGAWKAEDTPSGLPGVWLRHVPPKHPTLDRYPAYVPLSDAAIRNLYTRPFLGSTDPLN